MKTATLKFLLAIMSLIACEWVNAQTFDVYIANRALTGLKTLEFDVYIKSNGTTGDWNIRGYQCGYKFGSTFINGGSITGAYISGSSELTESSFGKTWSFSWNTSNKVLNQSNNTGSSCPGAAVGATAKKVGRFRVTNTVNFGCTDDSMTIVRSGSGYLVLAVTKYNSDCSNTNITTNCTSYSNPNESYLQPVIAGTLAAACDGTTSFTATPTGGISPYTSGTVSYGPYGPGTYPVSVTDSRGCTTTKNVVIATLPDVTPPTIASCSPSQNFTVASIDDSSAVPDFTSAITASDNCTASSALIITQSPAAGTTAYIGTTSVVLTVTDASGNSTTCTTSYVVNPPCQVSATATVTDVICYGGTNGSAVITLNGSGSASTGTYTLNGGSSATFSTNPFTLNGLSAGSYSVSITSGQLACPSTATFTISAPSAAITSSFSGSACDSYPLPWGTVANSTGAYTHTYTSVAGCDSLVTANITITNSTSNITSQSACDSYTWSVNGVTYTQSGSYSSVSGCHTEIINLTITTSTSNATPVTSCDSYTWSVTGATYTESGAYSKVTGCHTEILNLTIYGSTDHASTVSSCDSYSWSVTGSTYTQSGSYSSVTGCNTEILNLTITASTSNTTTASTCDSYTWSVTGQTYTTSGTRTSVSGCHTEILNLTITASTSNSTSESACDSYTWSVTGATYTESGTYSKVTGCHTETLNLTITASTSNSNTRSACDSYTWSVTGATYTSSGTYSKVTGCHTETLNLTITVSTSNTTTESRCDSYTWSVTGVTYSQSGSYSKVTGCHTENLNLTIINSTSNTTTQFACNSFTWSATGATYTQSGTYSKVTGCNTEILQLTVGKSNSSSTTVSICGNLLPYSWNGLTFESAGTQTATLTNVSGCDSLATLNLIVSGAIPAKPGTITQVLVSNECGNRIYRYSVPAVTNAVGYLWTLPTSVGGVVGVSVDSGDATSSRIIRISYASSAAASNTDSIKVKAFSGCGSSANSSAKLINVALSAPAAPASITVAAKLINVCTDKLYRYTAPLLPAGTATNAAPTGYEWSFMGTLGANAVIDSGTVNSRIIVVKYSSNAAAAPGDSVSLAYTSSCGNSAKKTAALTNVATSLPPAPATVTIAPISVSVCSGKRYRYTAPVLPAATAATATTATATGWVWSFSGSLGANAVIDSGDVNSRIITVIYSSNAAAAAGDSAKVAFTSICGNSATKAAALTNVVVSAPAAPASITITPVLTNVCTGKQYRYTAPLLTAASATVAPATGWEWSFSGTLGANANIDSGTINSRIILVSYSINDSSTVGDSVSVVYTSACGNSAKRTSALGIKMTLTPPTPASITAAGILTNVCSGKRYRFTAPVLPAATAANASVATATGYLWSFTGTLGADAVIDSGTVNSRIITVVFTSNAAADAGDSVRLAYTSACGLSTAKGLKLPNVATTLPAVPASITITPILTNVCTGKRYRYAAPVLPAATAATATQASATGYLWTFLGLGTDATIDSGDVNSRIITVTYSSNAAAGAGDSARVCFTSACGNGPTKGQKLSNVATALPAAPASITITPILTNVCSGKRYRYTAPVLPAATAATATQASATGYLWSFMGTLGADASIDSGDINSRIICVTYSSNAAAAISGDSVRVRFTSACGNGPTKGQKLSNVATTLPAVPASITITPILTNVCSGKRYRYAAPVLPAATAATATQATATGWQWSFLGLGTNAVIDSGNVNGRVITVTYSSNAAAGAGDSARVCFTSICGNGPTKGQKLSNVTTTAPAAPAAPTITLVSDVCGARVYRYAGPALPAASGATTTIATATGWEWSFVGSLYNSATIDSGSLSSRVLKLKFTSNAGAAAGDSARLAFTSDCGSGARAAKILSNVAKSGCPVSIPISKSTPVRTIDAGLEVKVYPNPTVNDFKLQVAAPSRDKQIHVRVLDVQGREYSRSIMMPGETINLGSNLKPGIYFIEALQGDKMKTTRAIKL